MLMEELSLSRALSPRCVRDVLCITAFVRASTFVRARNFYFALPQVAHPVKPALNPQGKPLTSWLLARKKFGTHASCGEFDIIRVRAWLLQVPPNCCGKLRIYIHGEGLPAASALVSRISHTQRLEIHYTLYNM